jgi:hypothetical protein
VLIDGDAEERAHRVPPRPRPRQEHRATRVITAGFVRRRHRLGHVQAADQHDAIAKRLQRFGDEREPEVTPHLQWAPVARRRTVRMPDPDEAAHRCCGRQSRRRQRRHHRLEQGQRQRHSCAAQERPAGDVLLRYEHLFAS